MSIGVYIDSNVLISSQRRSEKNHKESKKFIDFILKNGFKKNVEFLTSKFTLLEVAATMKRRTGSTNQAQALAWKLERSWKPKIGRIEPDKSDDWDDLLDSLIETAIKYRTTAADTVHAQIVIDYYVDYFVTWDKGFKRLARALKRFGMKTLNPTEMLMEIQKNKKKFLRKS